MERARGRESGIEVTQRFVHVWTMRHRRACRMRAYLDKREAMRAAGIAVDDQSGVSGARCPETRL
jgi:ketosteroid isomerase-like protein